MSSYTLSPTNPARAARGQVLVIPPGLPKSPADWAANFDAGGLGDTILIGASPFRAARPTDRFAAIAAHLECLS
jgi:hypothetical protein